MASRGMIRCCEHCSWTCWLRLRQGHAWPCNSCLDARHPNPDVRRRICLYCGRDDCDHIGVRR